MQGNMMAYPLTLNHLLERAGRLFPRTEIVSRATDRSLHRYTYADFHRRAKALARALQRAGLKPGERVGTLMWNGYRHLECYFGIPAASGVLHTLNLRLHADELAYIVNHAEDRFIIVEDVLVPLLNTFREKINPERVFVAGTEVAGAGPAKFESYEDLIAASDGDFACESLQENDAAALCYTSGTTGNPKGVLYSHRALVLHSFAICMPDAFAIAHNDVIMATMPMFHANAWGVPFAAVMCGSKLVFPGRHVAPEMLLELAAQEHVTLSGGVPTVWLAAAMALEDDPQRWKLDGMRVVIAGSAPPESLMRRLDAFGIRVIHPWGLTETSPIATVCYPKQHMRDQSPEEQYQLRTRQGLPCAFVDLRAMSETGEVPWDGASLGEVQVRGPWIAQRYFKLPSERDKWTDDGWFRTGDVVTIDADGYMKIADRTKDLIKSGGEWISSVDLENAIVGHPAVSEAAVIAVPHPKWQERPLAVVVMRENMSADADELRRYLCEQHRFAKWQLPDDFVFVSELPHTSTGKLLKKELRKQYGEWKWSSASSE
jgi:fatty-acyl-CoA synthase